MFVTNIDANAQNQTVTNEVVFAGRGASLGFDLTLLPPSPLTSDYTLTFPVPSDPTATFIMSTSNAPQTIGDQAFYFQNGLNNASARPALNTTGVAGEIRGISTDGAAQNYGWLRLSAGGGVATANMSYIDLSGSSGVADMDRNITIGTAGTERMRVTSAGNVLIGNTTGSSPLSVGSSAQFTVSSAGLVSTSSAVHATGEATFAGDAAGTTIRAKSTDGVGWDGFGAFGGSNNAVVMGEIGSRATLGAHASALGAWADLYINSAGSGNVRIGGTTAPANTLDITGSLGVSTTSTFTGTATFNGAVDANGQIDLGDGGDAFTLASTGLDITSGGAISNSTGYAQTSGTATFAVDDNTATAFAVTQGANNYFVVTTTDAGEKIQIAPNTSTEVGIGVASPVSALSNTATNTVGSTGTGITDQSLTWVSSQDGYTAAFYNSAAAGSPDGVAIKVNSSSAARRALDISRGATQNAAGTNIFSVATDGSLISTYSDASNTSAPNVLEIEHATSGTAAAGFGSGISMQLEESAGNVEDAALIRTTWTNATNTTEASNLAFYTRTGGGGIAANMTLDGSGNLDVTGALTLGTVLDEAEGGTGNTTYVLGDILYASAANTLSRLAGNITTTPQILMQTGTGAVSAAPAWTSAGGTFILNQTGQQTSANFNIDGDGTIGDVLTVTGNLDANGGATIDGATVTIGDNSTATITIGDGDETFSVASSAVDISSTGAVSGVTTLSADGGANNSFNVSSTQVSITGRDVAGTEMPFSVASDVSTLTFGNGAGQTAGRVMRMSYTDDAGTAPLSGYFDWAVDENRDLYVSKRSQDYTAIIQMNNTTFRLAEDINLEFEGTTDDGFEMTVSPGDPTADVTNTIPNLAVNADFVLDEGSTTLMDNSTATFTVGDGDDGFVVASTGVDITAGGAVSGVTTLVASTSATVPSVIGSTAVDGTLTLTSTTNAGPNTATANAILFMTGDGGATQAMRIRQDGAIFLPTNITHTGTDATFNNNVTLGASTSDDVSIQGTITNTTLTFDGATANDGNELFVSIPDAAADMTYTIPNAATNASFVLTESAAGQTINDGVTINGTFDANDAVSLGDGAETFEVASTGLDINTTGDISNAATITASAASLTSTQVLSVTSTSAEGTGIRITADNSSNGAANQLVIEGSGAGDQDEELLIGVDNTNGRGNIQAFLQGTGSAPLHINTSTVGTTTGADVVIGNGAATFSLQTANIDISTAGAISSATTIGATGTITTTATTALNLDASDPVVQTGMLNGDVTTLQDNAGNTMLTVTDDGTTATLAVNALSISTLSMTGDLDMNGNDINEVLTLNFNNAASQITNSGGDVDIAAALTQSGAGQVTLSGNVDANGGVDVTGDVTVTGATTLGNGGATDVLTVNTGGGLDAVISEGGISRNADATTPTFTFENTDAGDVMNVDIDGALTLGTVLDEAEGGTGNDTYVLGDILYSSAANTLSRLAGNTSATQMILTQTGTGVVSAAPVWTNPSGVFILNGTSAQTADFNITGDGTIGDDLTVGDGSSTTGLTLNTGGGADAVLTESGLSRTVVGATSYGFTNPDAGGASLMNVTVEGSVTAGNGVAVTAGGVNITAGGITVTAGGASINDGLNNNSDGITNAGTISGATGLTSTGNIDLTGAQVLGASPLVFEGSTDNNVTTTLALTDPSGGGNTITLPDESGRVSLTTSAGVALFTGPTVERTFTLPDANATLAYLNGGQTFTGGLTINGGLTLGTPLGVASGGTGFDASTVTDGQLLIGDDAANSFDLATLTATANETEVTNGAGSITIGLPNAVAITTSVTTPVVFGGTAANATLNLEGSSNATPSGDQVTITADDAARVTVVAATTTISNGLVANGAVTLGNADADAVAINTTGNFSVASSGLAVATTGNISDGNSDVTVADGFIVTGTSDLQGAISNSTGQVSINDGLVLGYETSAGGSHTVGAAASVVEIADDGAGTGVAVTLPLVGSTTNGRVLIIHNADAQTSTGDVLIPSGDTWHLVKTASGWHKID